ncbi:hypothetical protein [Streptomyces sp. NPDC090080]|uniref:hypothetical protein n=1 Tax=Streptomyces sp. NPDC090080 TaxID=3365939 RepID=UPI0038049895
MRSLILPEVAGAGELEELAHVFLSLTRLTIYLKAIVSRTIDLTPLRDHLGLPVQVLSSGPTLGIVGKEAFERRLTFRELAPSPPDPSEMLWDGASTPSS